MPRDPFELIVQTVTAEAVAVAPPQAGRASRHERPETSPKRRLIEQKAPPAPACFRSRSDWVTWLHLADSSAEIQVVRVIGRGRAAGGRVKTAELAPFIDYCVDCTPDYAAQMKRMGRCHPPMRPEVAAPPPPAPVPAEILNPVEATDVQPEAGPSDDGRDVYREPALCGPGPAEELCEVRQAPAAGGRQDGEAVGVGGGVLPGGEGGGVSDAYDEFLRAKVQMAESFGFAVEPHEINPKLKPHQAAIVQWAVAGGRRAIFCAFGLGKTVIQLETVRLTRERAGGMGLIVIPLGVRLEFMRDAAMLGIRVKFIRSIDEADDPAGIYLTNYETVRDGKLDPRAFTVASLDEAACLRGFGGTKTFREFMASFAGDDRRNMHERVRSGAVPFRFVATATPSPNEYVELLAYCAFLGVMDVGQAKAQPLDAKVMTPVGWRFMGDLQVGDQVIAGDGTPTRVLGVYPQGERPIFRIKFSDGTSTEADAEHLWLTQTQYERNNERRWRDRNQGEPGDRYASVRTTAAIAATLRTDQGGKNHTVPLVAPVQLSAQPVLIDPWLLGFLLGDACIRDTSVVLSTVDEWIVEEAAARLSILGLRLRRTTEAGCDYSITSTGKQGGQGPGSNALLAALREYGLLGKRSWEKSIPSSYIINDVPTRLAILQGLMDADGTVHEDGTMIRFSSSSRILAEQVQELVRSLGGIATIRTVATTGRDAHRVTLSLPAGMVPFRLPRKADRVTPREKYPPARYIVAVEPVGKKPAQCIAIEHPSRLYVTDDFVVTHNTRFFKRNSEKADQLTIHPHKEREFWLWMASWALFVQRPSDLGFSDEGYELPALDVRWHEVDADHEQAGVTMDGQCRLFKAEAIGVVEAAREKRESLPARLAKLMELRAEDPQAHRVLWHDLEAERDALERAIPGLTTVYGSQELDEREQAVMDFSDGRIPELAAKPVMLGSGCNLQRHCAWAIFMGIGFKFADLIQAIHRLQRFLQTRTVRVDFIYTSAERSLRRVIERKWQQHREQMDTMSAIIKEFGLSKAAMAQNLTRALGVKERIEVRGRNFVIANNDCVDETRRMESDSVGLILTSIPFSTQYEYSPNYADFGHTDSNGHFFEQMDFLTPELLRVLHPGRLAAIHVKDRIVPGGMTGLGFQTVYPFHADTIRHFQKHGFAYMGMKTIVTDVVRENNQTYRLGWSEQCKDATKMGVGMPEYLLIFRKPPTDRTNSYADRPVVKLKPFSLDEDGNMVPFDREKPMKVGTGYSRARWQLDAHGFTRSSGNRLVTAEEMLSLPHDVIFKVFKEHSLRQVYDFEQHVRIGEVLEAAGKLPVTFMLLQPQSWSDEVWADVTRMLTLNGAQSAKGREMHLCPMQFDIADRAIAQWSMPGEEVYDPFGGLMTVPFRAIKLGRRGRAAELNPGYFLDGAAYCKAAEQEAATPTLFDFEELEAA